MDNILNYEVNFLTEDDQLSGYLLSNTIKKEFDFIRSCQGMSTLFGYDAKSALDNYIALSLRKLLCDKESLIRKICPSFRMPPLSGKLFICNGEKDDMKLKKIETNIVVKPESEWISLDEWLNEKIAWIEKDSSSIPDGYSDSFFSMLSNKIAQKDFTDLFECIYLEKDIIWKIKNPQRDKQTVYEILRSYGYYDLNIRTLIKHIADKNGAHLDDKKSLWIRMANDSSDINTSAISAFATQMIYAATKQIVSLKDYYTVPQMMEITINEA